MRIRLSKNKHAVQEALDLFELDGHAAAKHDDGRPRGPRGIVNARRLGLSKHRCRAARTANPKRVRAWQSASVRRELREQAEKSRSAA